MSSAIHLLTLIARKLVRIGTNHEATFRSKDLALNVFDPTGGALILPNECANYLIRKDVS
jgi:hypothetical protein